jgi:hypothetical protein
MDRTLWLQTQEEKAGLAKMCLDLPVDSWQTLPRLTLPSTTMSLRR